MKAARSILSHALSGVDFPSAVEDLLENYPFDASEECVFTWRVYDRPLSANRLIFPKRWFEDTETVAFEDTMMPIPHKAHDYLTSDFGDYMQLPPQDERRSAHDIVVADMNHPYESYQPSIL